ncbi:MAG: polymer-forming cytoskeletal protein [Alphaproteobacteria bacterium]|nr:polymer-forming cytoskeletal protein [Alphaproteobacteria bacterium]
MDKPGDKSSEGALFIGAGVELKGDVEVPGAASVDGKFEGTLKAKTLIVGQTGHVSGQISVETAEIRGMVEDHLTVRNRLVLRSSGSIAGTIAYSKIMVEEGGSISGSIEMMARGAAQPAEPEAKIVQLHQGAE